MALSYRWARLTVLLLTLTSIRGAPSTTPEVEDPDNQDQDVADVYHNAHKIGCYGKARRFIEDKDPEFWIYDAQKTLSRKLSKPIQKRKAKNVIMFLGDGMSIATLTATRAYLGQKNGRPGEETVLSWENFPNTGLSKTYCVDSQVADSACSATAYLGGVKGNIGTIGVSARVKLNNCEAMRNASNHVSSILQWSQEAGKSTGIVTTTRVTHASPAGAYAHTANRDWESIEDVADSGQDTTKCPSIAEQLVRYYPGRGIKVIFGGGRSKFSKSNTDLIEEWKSDKKNKRASYKYVKNRKELLKVDTKKIDYVLGLFSSDHMKYHLESDPERYPTLEEMTRSAIQILSKERNGFFLFVEGGRIDHGHHSTKAHIALDETVELTKAVQAAVNMTEEDDTLIVITSDHGHTMTISGYPARGNPIFSVAGKASDGMPYATLSYANGPGFSSPRRDLSQDNMDDINYRFPATTPLSSETHDGSDVGIFARGPWSHLFTGVLEQNVIPHLMAYASCVGNALTSCHDRTVEVIKPVYIDEPSR